MTVFIAHMAAQALSNRYETVNPDVLIVSYQGDGDAYNIGIARPSTQTYRNENITVVVVNNTNFGMTGGQMSLDYHGRPKTSTSIYGRDCGVTGYPLRFPEMVCQRIPKSYCRPSTVTSPAKINQLKGYIKNGLMAQMNHEGYSVIEVLSPMPGKLGTDSNQGYGAY